MSDTSSSRARDAGERIVLTRSAEDCEDWAASLRERGFEPVSLPCITTEAVSSNALRTSLADALTKADWLVLTSQRGADALARLLAQPLPEALRIATVGATTAHKARSLFGRVDFVAGHANAAALARELAQHLAGSQSLLVLALAANAGNVLADTLRDAGHRCQRFDIYRTVPVSVSARKRSLSDIGASTVFLASPSAVLGFFNQVEIDDTVRLVSIGPTTSAAIQRVGMEVYAQAQSPSLKGMLEALED